MSEVTSRHWQNPEYRQRHTEINRRRWQDPEIRYRMLNAIFRNSHDPEWRRKQKQAQRKPECRARTSRYWDKVELAKELLPSDIIDTLRKKYPHGNTYSMALAEVIEHFLPREKLNQMLDNIGAAYHD